MKRTDVDDKYKWDLTKIIKNEKEYNEYISKINKLSDEVLEMKGHILDNSDTLKKYLDVSNEMNLFLERLYVYSFLEYYSDTTNSSYKEKSLIAEKLNDDISKKLSFVEVELLSKDYDYIKSLLKYGLEEYEFYFEKLFRYKDMTLSEEEEKIITEATAVFGTGHDAFNELDNSDVYFDSVFGEELTHSNFINYLKNKDENVRREAFKKYYKYFIDRKNTLAACYAGHIKENFFKSNIRKFDSPLEYSLYHDNIDKELYTNLISVCHDKRNLMYEYLKLRKEYLKLDEMHMYDIYVDMIKLDNAKVTYSEAKNIIFDALKPLGETYLNDLKQAFLNSWIDVMPNEGKRSGAYEWNTYRIDPYVSLNYENNMDSVNTLIHELGHAMHSYYSDKSNSYLYNSYPIFLAEIASTVNEVLLNEYLINNAKTKEEKIKYICKFLNQVRTTIFRQTKFAEFEMIMHDKYKNNIPLTEKEFSDTYYELNKLYYGENIIHDDEIRLEWARIPHFYTSFYVYKYATGLASALIIANNIINKSENAVEDYMNFLSSGSSDYPLNILEKCNIDIRNKKVLENAFDLFESRLNELKELIEVK